MGYILAVDAQHLQLLPESKYAMISANKNVPKMENSDALFSENSDV